jgi:hypothetical protein
MDTDRIAELERQIVDLKECWPAHSVPSSMSQQLEEVREELKKWRCSDGAGGENMAAREC